MSTWFQIYSKFICCWIRVWLLMILKRFPTVASHTHILMPALSTGEKCAVFKQIIDAAWRCSWSIITFFAKYSWQMTMVVMTIINWQQTRVCIDKQLHEAAAGRRLGAAHTSSNGNGAATLRSHHHHLKQLGQSIILLLLIQHLLGQLWRRWLSLPTLTSCERRGELTEDAHLASRTATGQ